MLPAAYRLTDAHSFRTAIGAGRRAGARTLVVHVGDAPPGSGPRIGLVVSRAVGNAVTRNRVQRRLRHLAREQLDLLPACALVIRALPAAADASSAELRDDLARCLQRAVGRKP